MSFPAKLQRSALPDFLARHQPDARIEMYVGATGYAVATVQELRDALCKDPAEHGKCCDCPHEMEM